VLRDKLTALTDVNYSRLHIGLSRLRASEAKSERLEDKVSHT